MKRSYASSNVLTSTVTLHAAIDSLCKRVLKSQTNKASFLHDSIKSLINRYHAPLKRHFGLELHNGNDIGINEDIWQKLMTADRESMEIRSKRHDLLRLKNHQYRAPQVPYNNFIKALYPHNKRNLLDLNYSEKECSGFVNNAIKYELINHNLVYKYYCELPHPATSYMKPNHLDDFLSRFLYRRDFIKPNSFSSWYTRSASVMYSTYNEMLELRAEHLAMCTRILNDMKESELPLSIEEQNQFVFMSFFRDRADIHEKLENAIEQLTETDNQNLYVLTNKNKFDWNIYQLIKSQFESNGKSLNIDSYNTLLFISMRHNQHDVIADILKNLGLNDLLDHENHILNELNTVTKRETIELLLDYFSSQAFREFSQNQNSVAFTNTVNYLTNLKNITPDIRTINKVIKGLTNMKRIEEAEFLVSKLIIDPLIEEAEQTLLERMNPDLSIYKGLTSDDKQLYKKLLRQYDHLKEILSSQDLNINVEPYKLMPNESSFRPLVYSYCSPNSDKNSFQKSAYIISVIEDHGLPLTTRIFHAMFSKFIEINKHNSDSTSNWNLDELNHITVKLISAHDYTNGVNQDTLMRNKVDDLLLSAKLKSFVNKNLDGKNLQYIPRNRGSFVKFSDSLIHQVYQAYIFVLNNDPNMTSSQKKEFSGTIDLLREDLLNDIKRIRSSSPQSFYKGGSKQMVFINDEITYIKKGFLVDLIDLTYSI